jgi:hypothetical protein
MIMRDGGTIVFEISGTQCAAKYRLQTPFAGKPEPLFRDEQKLNFGSAEEFEVANQLRGWLDQNLNESRRQHLAELDELKEWRNLPSSLSEVIPYHRIRDVLSVLESRLTHPDTRKQSDDNITPKPN